MTCIYLTLVWQKINLKFIKKRLTYFSYFSYSPYVISSASVFLVATITAPADALTLSESILFARQSDPQFLSAQANQSAANARSTQAFGALLPQLSLSVNSATNQRTYETYDSASAPSVDSYKSKSQQLNLTQHIWHSASRDALHLANAAAAQARAQLALAEQDLLLRLTQAWLDVMLAQDNKNFSWQQKNAAQNQFEQAQRAVLNGLIASPAEAEAGTKYAQALADLAGAQTELLSKLAALEQITGSFNAQPDMALSEDFLAADPQGKSLAQWLAESDENHPAILAAVQGLEAAKQELNKQISSHEPTLEASASYGRNSQNVGSFPGQNGYAIRQLTLGLQLTIPLYSGGTQSAKVAEAKALERKAEHDLEAAKRSAKLLVKQAWLTWQAGFARQSAALQAIKFTRLILQAANQGKALGLKTDQDVLQAEQQLASALRDLNKSRYDMIISGLKLKSAVGQLGDADLSALEVWFIPNRLEEFWGGNQAISK